MQALNKCLSQNTFSLLCKSLQEVYTANVYVHVTAGIDEIHFPFLSGGLLKLVDLRLGVVISTATWYLRQVIHRQQQSSPI